MSLKIRQFYTGLTIIISILSVSPVWAASFECPSIVIVQGDMGIKTRYLGRNKDSTSSTLVPELVEEQADIRAHVNYPAKKIVDIGALYLKQRDNPKIRLCFLRHINALSDMNYLQGSGDANIVYKSWLLSAITITALKLDQANLSFNSNDTAFRQWATFRAQEIAGYYRKEGCTNNHCYWGGVATAAVGRYTSNTSLFDFSRWTLKHARASIDKQGFLPAELRRGKRALHYTVFATAALISQVALLGEHYHSNSVWLETLASQACKSVAALNSKDDFKNLGKQDVTGTAPYLFLLKAYRPQQCGNSTKLLPGQPKAFFLGWDLGYINSLATHSSN